MVVNRLFRHIILALVLLGTSYGTLYALEPTVNDLNIRYDAKGGTTHAGYIDGFKSYFGGYFFGGTLTGEKGAKYLMVTIARDLKNLFMFIAVIYLFVMVLKLLFSGGGDEDAKKWKLGILWTSVGIAVMQIAYVFISTLFDKQVVGYTASVFLDNIIYPFVRLLQLLASFAFLAMAFYAFFRIASAAGDEEKVKKGKNTIIAALIGFLAIKLPGVLVTSIYGKAECTGHNILGVCEMTITDPNISDTIRVMTKLVNYFNSFIGLIVVLLIIYAGWLVISSAGAEENVKKAKGVIKYAIIGIFLLVASYSLFNFFVLKG